MTGTNHIQSAGAADLASPLSPASSLPVNKLKQVCGEALSPSVFFKLHPFYLHVKVPSSSSSSTDDLTPPPLWHRHWDQIWYNLTGLWSDCMRCHFLSLNVPKPCDLFIFHCNKFNSLFLWADYRFLMTSQTWWCYWEDLVSCLHFTCIHLHIYIKSHPVQSRYFWIKTRVDCFN